LESSLVSLDHLNGEKVIVAKPNHSSTWRHNLWLLAALAIPSLGAGVGFALAGAWPILPLAGIELAALGGALYWVNWKLEYRHVIRVGDDVITVDKGYFVPKRTWHFTRDQSALRVVPEPHHWQGPALSVHDRMSETRVGEFLNREETLELLGYLRDELRIRTHSRDSALKA
tara:strand:+ start:1382 stop:1897 length:516 start_codon:yes stop_codon:yes gene_type:complete